MRSVEWVEIFKLWVLFGEGESAEILDLFLLYSGPKALELTPGFQDEINNVAAPSLLAPGSA